MRGNWVLAALIAALLPVSTGYGDTARAKLAILDPAEADADFFLQGEYLGYLLSPRGGYQHVGLQVVAHGEGLFDAAFFAGGLPGAGWTGSPFASLSGRRQGAGAELTNSDWRITLQDGYAAVRDTAGRFLGRIPRIDRISPTAGRRGPYGALTLFDGTETSHFKNARTTDDGLLMVGTELQDVYRDFTMHVEFRLPYMPYARGQGRANSGVYLQSRYEVQILDSFGLEGKENECGSLYRYKAPDVNMCYPPLRWQTYDIVFQSPRFDENGNKTRNARLTVWHNGVVVHNDFEVERKTGGGAAESPQLLPTKLQDHGNPVMFRNIWLVSYEAEETEPAPSQQQAPQGNYAAPGYAWPGASGYPAAPGYGAAPGYAAAPAYPGVPGAPVAAAAPPAMPGAVVWPPFAYTQPIAQQGYPLSMHYPSPSPAFAPVPPLNYQPLQYPAGHPSTAPYPLAQVFPAVYYQPAYYPPGHPATVPYPPVQHWQGIYVYPSSHHW